MTCEKPVPAQSEPNAEHALLFRIGDKGSMRIAGSSLVGIETLPVTDKRLMSAWEHEIYRILVRAESAEMDIVVH